MARRKAAIEESNQLSPMVASVTDTLRADILNGRLPAGKPLPSERALALELGVSRVMVRHAVAALAESGLLETRPRCRPVVRSVEGQRRRERATGIGIWLWPQTSDFIAASLFRGIQSRLAGTGFRLVVGTAAPGTWEEIEQSESDFLRELAEDPSMAGGIVWYLGGARNIPDLHRLQSIGLPLVFVDRTPPDGVDADHAGTDNKGSAQRAVGYLTDIGHRNIVCLQNADTASSVRDRVQGYRAAMAWAGVSPSEARVETVDVLPGETEIDAMRRTLWRLCEETPRPTALFAINDTLALRAMECLATFGFSVPDDISVLGFDGLLRWVPGEGRLTTARQDFHRIGELASELLLDRLRGETPRAFRHVLLEAPLILNGSTAPISETRIGTSDDRPLETVP